MTTTAIPEGYHSLTPYLVVRDAKAALAFYARALNAVAVMCLPMPDGRVAHAEMKVGNSHFMLSEEMPERGAVGPATLGGAGVRLMLYTEDCDALFKQALAAGGEQLMPMQDQFYGDRSGTLQDPFGHVWTIGTHQEDLTPDQIAARMARAGG
jgi:PhnB protein